MPVRMWYACAFVYIPVHVHVWVNLHLLYPYIRVLSRNIFWEGEMVRGMCSLGKGPELPCV